MALLTKQQAIVSNYLSFKASCFELNETTVHLAQKAAYFDLMLKN